MIGCTQASQIPLKVSQDPPQVSQMPLQVSQNPPQVSQMPLQVSQNPPQVSQNCQSSALFPWKQGMGQSNSRVLTK